MQFFQYFYNSFKLLKSVIGSCLFLLFYLLRFETSFLPYRNKLSLWLLNAFHKYVHTYTYTLYTFSKPRA